jgi:hypothetical protein
MPKVTWPYKKELSIKPTTRQSEMLEALAKANKTSVLREIYECFATGLAVKGGKLNREVQNDTRKYITG